MIRDKETTLYLGPQHPGITGNMMVQLKVAGDTVVEAKSHIGYLHRAFEKLMEQRTWMQCFPIVCRICVPEPDPNEENLARAIEALDGIEVPERAKYIRVMVLEMSRLASYLLWMGGQSGSMGLYTMPQWTVGDRDYLLDRFEELTGGRVYHLYIWAGGVRRDLPDGFVGRMKETLNYLESRLPDYDRLFFNNALFIKRAQGVGYIDPARAREWGVVGPPLRGCGFRNDVRIDTPYEVYDQLEFEVPTHPDGDVYARAMVRRIEFQQSINIIRQVLDKMPSGPGHNQPPNPLKWKVAPGSVYVKTESARGEFG